jgi:hypothetical protein
MLGKVNKLMNRRQKVLGVFLKLVKKLEKHNAKLEQIHFKAQDEILHHQVVAKEAKALILNNAKTMNKIKEFTE